jgi:S1-C subfamily serine protease
MHAGTLLQTSDSEVCVRTVITYGALACALVGCSGGYAAPSTTVTTTTSAATTTTVATTTTTVGPLNAKAVLGEVGPSLVFLENEFSTGSGFAIDGGYIATNAHVVGAFATIDVTPPGGDTIADVPVVAVDFEADLAIVGPLDVALEPVVLADTLEVERGDEVFLLGFPSETDTSPEVTISQGIVSRLRDAEEFNLSFVQTDADIAGGQSGGVLVDDRGQVIGVSGLSLDEAFALATASEDVSERLDALLADGGPTFTTYPTRGGALTGTLTVPSRLISTDLTPLPSPKKRTITLRIDSDAEVGFEVYGTEFYLSENVLPLTAELYGLTVEEVTAELEQQSILQAASDGTYTFDIAADDRPSIKISRLSGDGPAEVTFTSSEPLVIIDDLDPVGQAKVGDEIRGSIDPLEWNDVYSIDLVADQSITIAAQSVIGDMAFAVLEPGQSSITPETFFVDDSDLGLGGLDASDTFTASVAGTYQIVVTDNSGGGGYLLSITDG